MTSFNTLIRAREPWNPTWLKVIGEKLTDDEIEDAIKLADAGGDGEVDYDEFIQFVLSD